MKGPYRPEHMMVECGCDCATQCPQGRIGSERKCQIPVTRQILMSAVRSLDRQRQPPDFTLRIFGKTIFEGWV